MNILVNWNWCTQEGVTNLLSFVKAIINIIRIIVPIALIVLTSVDIMNKVINPDDKEGQKKIMNRALAALIIFLIPTFIKLSFKIIDWSAGVDGSYDNDQSGLSSCWR